jgi:hypothetical protein
MAKNRLNQKERFTSFKNGFCPYCGSGGAKLEELTTHKGQPRGFRGACSNPDCKAENFFTNEKAQEWNK